MPKKSVKKQKRYAQEMREKAKQGFVNTGGGQWVKASTSADQMHVAGARHGKA